jgi:bacillithiol system protein YtxJ
MNWQNLENIEQLSKITQQSENTSCVLFKHSTKCSISNVAWQRMKNASLPENAEYYYLDLLAHRDISNAIAEKFSVHHESPQVLLIKKGECTYTESHLGITPEELTEQLEKN